MKRKKVNNVLCILLFFGLTACCYSCMTSKKLKEQNEQYLYFQKNLQGLRKAPLKERIIQPGDLITIQVLSNSLNQEQTMIFNLTGTTTNASGSIANSTNNAIIPTYLVNAAGEIEVPVIGKMKADSLTKDQLEATLIDKLSSYVKNPIVLIRFADFRVNVLGEVKTPGYQNFQKDKVTIIDALGSAGDLTDFAKREDITVLREENGSIKHYTIDIRDGMLFKSPAYQLRPNDIVYVGANATKMKNLKNNAYNPKNTQVFIGIASITTALLYLLSSIIRNN